MIMAENATIGTAELLDLIREKYGVDTTGLTRETQLNDIGLDSLALVELTLTLQKKFGIELGVEQVKPEDDFGTLEDAVTAGGVS
jgi:acyl carrier protein